MRNLKPGAEGCGFLLATCLFSCCFLVINSLLVATAFTALRQVAPQFFERARIAQILLFAGPVVLVFFEWWLFDFVLDRLSIRGDRQDAARFGRRR